MDFNTERELQTFLNDFFESLGYSTRMEISLEDGGRVDLLTDHHLIETKLTLTRSSIFQAAGQLQTYRSYFPNHRHVIAGLSPTNFDDANAAAQRVRDNGIEVWFVDRLDDFIEYYEESYSIEPEPTYSFTPSYGYSYNRGHHSSDQSGAWIGALLVFFVFAAAAGGSGANSGQQLGVSEPVQPGGIPGKQVLKIMPKGGNCQPFRREPDVNSSDMGCLMEGSKVISIGPETQSGWVPVKDIQSSTHGWIYYHALTPAN